MKKQILFIYFISAIAGIFFAACDNETPQEPIQSSNAIFITLHPKTFVVNGTSSPIQGENQIENINAYHFIDGKLKQCFTNPHSTAENQYQIDVTEKKGTLYLLANVPKLDKITEGMYEEDFLQLPTAEGDASPKAMSGIIPIGTDATYAIDMKHGAARIDLLIKTSNVKVKNIRINHVAQQGYLFAQDVVQDVPNTSFTTISQQFDPFITESKFGLFYLHEQNNEQMTVNILTEIDGIEKTLESQLPEVIKRNHVYSLEITESENTNLHIEIKEWDSEDGIIATPDVSNVIRIDRTRSQIPSSVKITSKEDYDMVEIPYTRTELQIALNAQSEVELIPESNYQDLTIEKNPDGTYLGNNFRIRTALRHPGEEIQDVIYKIKFKHMNNAYEDKIIFRLKANENQFDGQLIFNEDFVCQFNTYIDNELGTLTPAPGKIVNVEVEDPQAPWLRITESEEKNGTFRIVAGWRPNDPEADGRPQKAKLIISDLDGNNREEYTIIRRNYGLPVTLMNGIYWCKYNSMGNPKNFEEQILVPDDPAVTAGKSVLEYLNECSATDYIKLWKWSYQGNKPMQVVEGDQNVVHEGFVTGGISNTNQLDPYALAPSGYEMPHIEYYNRIFQEYWMYIDRSGGPYNVYTPWENNRQVFVTSGSRYDLKFGTITLPQTFHFEVFNKINGVKKESVTFYGPGAQWGEGGVNHNKILFACYSANGNGWYNGTWGLQFNGGGPKDTRIVRFIKSPVEFIY